MRPGLKYPLCLPLLHPSVNLVDPPPRQYHPTVHPGSQGVVTGQENTNDNQSYSSECLLCARHSAMYLMYLVLFKLLNGMHAQSCPTLCNPMDYSLPGSSVRGIFSGKNTGVGCHFLLQGIFVTQGSTHISCTSCMGKRILYHWCHQRSQVS